MVTVWPSTFQALGKCGSPLTHLTINLAGRKEGLEGGSKPNDVEETRWHQALENDQKGILGGGKRADIGSLSSCPSFTSKNLCPDPTSPPCLTPTCIWLHAFDNKTASFT